MCRRFRSLTNSIFSITKMRWNNHRSSLPDTHVLKAHVHPHHHLSRSQNYVVGLAKAVSGEEGKKNKNNSTYNTDFCCLKLPQKQQFLVSHCQKLTLCPMLFYQAVSWSCLQGSKVQPTPNRSVPTVDKSSCTKIIGFLNESQLKWLILPNKPPKYFISK